ncbi:MAG: EAL domain-containing protein [Burkholderiales bacterium]
MRSGYESFLRRQLLKPHTPAPRWSETRPAPTVPARLEPPAPAVAAADAAEIATLRAPLPEQLDETMPAVLWRESQAPADTGPGVDVPALADAAAAPVSVETISLAPVAPVPPAAADTPPQAAPAPTIAVPAVAPRTGHPLDAALAAALVTAKQRSGLGAVVRIGLARLDEIGDAFGEPAVARVLRALHQRLTRLLADVAPQASSCTTGDGLWLLLPTLDRPALAEALVRQVLESLTRPLKFGAHALALHGSAGLAVFPHDGTEPAGLRHAAEVAWRQARVRGRSAYQFYAREIEARALRRLTLEARLRHAITHDELMLTYQPRAQVKTGALCGAEVLPSWEPQGEAGWRTPELLLLAEESGLGEALAHWCLRTTAQQLRRWLEAGLAVPRLCVPVLPSAFKRASFVDALLGQIQSLGIEPQRLALLLSPVAPLTGGAAQFNSFELASGAARLQQCRAAGLHLAIDGTATSACSLSTLRQLPLSEMRLDCSRFDALDQHSAGFNAAVVALGHRLGLSVVASGVSDEAQLDQLRLLGCDEFQGALLADSLSAETWAEVMAGAQTPSR